MYGLVPNGDHKVTTDDVVDAALVMMGTNLASPQSMS
jgi:hypothetical protein